MGTQREATQASLRRHERIAEALTAFVLEFDTSQTSSDGMVD